MGQSCPTEREYFLELEIIQAKIYFSEQKLISKAKINFKSLNFSEIYFQLEFAGKIIY